MVKQVNYPVVPALPTTRIPDTATRTALQTLAAGWEVRNGNTDQRFITKAELNDSAATIVSKGFSQLFSGDFLEGGEGGVGVVIDSIAQSIMQSKLWQYLGERIAWITMENNRSIQRIEAMEVTAGDHWEEVAGIKLAIDNNWAAWLLEKELQISANEALATRIDTLAVKVGTNQSAIQNFQSTQASWNSAYATTINTLWTNVGNNTSLIQEFKTTQNNWNTSVAQQYSQLQTSLGQNQQAIQQEALARQTADGTMLARYTVKIDQNGYVSGYGLMSEANNATPRSDFIVRADRFAIGSPSGPGITPRVPFMVLTTTDAAGNPPGVYMDTAFIRNATIDTAKIKDLAVDTLKIAGNAVTIPVSTQVYPNATIKSTDSPIEFARLSINYKIKPSAVLLIASVNVGNTGSVAGLTMQFARNGSVLIAEDHSITGGQSNAITFTYLDQPSAGTITYVINFGGHINGQYVLRRVTFTAMGVYR
jgi:hypothetical protein